jgi:hypothetical protein
VVKKTVARLALVAAGLVAGSVAASSAFAAGGTAADAHGNVANSAQTLGAAKGAATLPFTGLGLALIVAAGMLLVALGVGIRRASNARS